MKRKGTDVNSLLIIWNDSDSFDIPVIDEQHRALVATINSLYYLLRTNHSKEALPAVTNMVREYMNIHSLTEEGIMEAAEYPSLLHHKEIHGNLSGQSIAASYRCMLLNDPLEILGLLKNWWLIHIREEDRDYVPYVVKYMHSLKRAEHSTRLYPETTALPWSGRIA